MKMKQFVAEGIGTFLLIFIGCGCMVYLNEPLAVAISFGLVYFILFYSLGNISGCHFNPIISISYLINKKISVAEFFCYIFGQLTGGFLGGLLIKIIIPVNTDFNTYSTFLCCNGDVIAAIFVEVILAYLFTMTFIGANSKSRNKNIRGLIICGGVTIVALFSYILNYSLVNPVKALVSSVFSNNYKHLFVFLIAPFIGGVIGTINFNWFHKKDDEVNE